MPGRNMPMLEGSNGGCQLKQNQPLHPGGLGGVMGTFATLLLKIPLRVIVFLMSLARASTRGFMDWALNILGKAVSYIVAKYQLLFGIAVGIGLIVGAVGQNLDGHSNGSYNLKILATTDLQVPVGTILAIVGSLVFIAAWWMHSRRPAFTEADIMDGLAMGPAVARRSDPTFEIHPYI